MLIDVPDLDLDTWTPIASRPRMERGKWKTIEGAPMSLKQAQKLREQGALLQALRLDGENAVVVVKWRRGDPAQ